MTICVLLLFLILSGVGLQCVIGYYLIKLTFLYRSQNQKTFDIKKGIKDLSIDEMVGPDALAVCRAHQGLPVGYFCSGIQFYLLLSPYLCFISLLYLDLYVLGDDALIS